MYWYRLIAGLLIIAASTILWFWLFGKLLDMISAGIDSVNEDLEIVLKVLKDGK